MTNGAAMPDRPDPRLINDDLAPTAVAERTWNLWHIASLWVGMSVCIPTYMLAASMIDAGMNWWQSLLAIVLGNAIVLVPLVISAHAGTRYGIPFPVFARASFGVSGAHVPSLLRSLVACGWFGIQTWIGGLAINVILGILWGGWADLGGGWTFMGYGAPQYIAFLLFWLLNIWFVWSGTESIKWLETAAAPFLILMGVGLLVWATSKAGGIGTILRQSDALVRADAPTGMRFFTGLFLPWLTAMVGYWATLSLNIPDFTRYARSQRDQAVGQAIGLLTTMPLFAFIGVAVTSATVLLYGQAIWNPIELLARLTSESGSPLLPAATGCFRADLR
jgi:NCS1 family nucleobase:cation symporter-1